MLWLATRELTGRRVPTLLTALGLLTATVGFLVLASTSRTTQAVLVGDIHKSWSAPYDLLVRPQGSTTPLEDSQGLVRSNFLSIGGGGISRMQLNAIRSLSSVQVAAPIAVVGYSQWPAWVSVDLSSAVQGGAPLQFYRLLITATADNGMSRIPYSYIGYVAIAPAGVIHIRTPRNASGSSVMEYSGGHIACLSRSDPDAPRCWAPTYDCETCIQPDVPRPGSNNGPPGFSFPIPQWLMVAGIDPEAESELDHLNSCLTGGQYLTAGAIQATLNSDPRLSNSARIPVLASSRSFLDETFQLKVDRASVASSAIASPADATWSAVTTVAATASDIYKSIPLTGTVISGYLRAGAVSYSAVGADHLAAVAVPPDFGVFDTRILSGAPQSHTVPDEARDVWFRPLSPSDWRNNSGENPRLVVNFWQPTGSYDPRCVAGFDRTGGGRLEAFAPPQVTLLDGRQLGPTRSPAGYVNPPPLLLTTLEGAEVLADPAQYDHGAGQQFISAIRVKVAGVDQPGPVAQARLARSAAEIHDATGLQVDIVRGSSPRAISVDLPMGKFGRPALTVSEGWAVKGVAVRFLQAVATQDVVLFALVLVAAMVLVTETAFVSVSRRRSEFGVLRAMGWSGGQIASLVEAEMLILGAVVGAIALVLGTPLVVLLGRQAPAWQLVLVIPLSIAVAGAAAALPALTAARGSAINVVIRQAKAPSGSFPRSTIGLGLTDLRRRRSSQLFLSAGAMCLGAATLGVLIVVEAAFRGQLDTTVLGTYLAGQVRPFHFALALLTSLIGAIAAGQVITLGALERRPQFSVLRAAGWSPMNIASVLLGEACGLGALAAGIAIVVVVVASLLLGAGLAATIWAIVSVVLMALASSGVAVIAPLAYVYRWSASAGLSVE